MQPQNPLACGLMAACLLAGMSTLTSAQQQPAGKLDSIARPAAESRPIDMVIVLDTSGSMENLIDSARSRIWSIVLKLADAKPVPKLRIGLLTYGSPGNSLEEDGWVKKQIDLTDELDEAFTKMMAMSTEGGDEFVGWALNKALRNMAWSTDPDALRLIYIAGNESADQAAEVHNFRDVAKAAEGRDIIINALYGGAPVGGVAEAWDKIPSLNGGEYFAIDMAAGTVQIATPFDVKLEQLNLELNATLIPYGKEGEVKLNAVICNDAGAAQLGATANASRIAAKGCVLWCNTRWDLVDACAQTDFKLADLAKEDLPEFMREMSPEERETYIQAMKAAREAVKVKISAANEKRQEYIQRVRALTDGNVQQSLDEAIMSSLARQAQGKGFVIELKQSSSTDAPAEELASQEEIVFKSAVDRLVAKLPRIQYEIGVFRTFEQDIAEQFATATKMQRRYVIGGDSFKRLEDAQTALRVAMIRHAGQMMQVEKIEHEIVGGFAGGITVTEYHIAGQVLSSKEAADEVAQRVNHAMKDTAVAATPEDVITQARKMFAAGLRAVAELGS
ncbi:MAG: VWA domain-containing protein [Pirellulales bacterium]|nr:VWA domain-containing protein [Pirellulales bacterium]